MSEAGVYSGVMHYLKAVQAAGTDETDAVAKVMRETPVNDFFARNGRIREDGRMVHDMFMFEVKKPAEFKGAVGLLQARRYPRRRGISVALAIPLPPGEEVSSKMRRTEVRRVAAW